MDGRDKPDHDASRHRSTQPCSLLASTGAKVSVAFLSSAATSAPPIALVSATPKTSRNSVTGTICGRPARAILAEPSRHSNYCLPNFELAIVSVSR